MKNFKCGPAIESAAIILTMLSCWGFFVLSFLALLADNNAGCVYYGIGLILTGVALKLELDAAI